MSGLHCKSGKLWKKRNALALKEKIQVLDVFEEGQKQWKIAEFLKSYYNQIRKIKSEAKILRKKFEDGSTNLDAKVTKNMTKYPQVDDAV